MFLTLKNIYSSGISISFPIGPLCWDNEAFYLLIGVVGDR